MPRTLLALVALVFAAGCGGRSPTQPDANVSGFFDSAGARLHYRVDLPSGPLPHPAIVIGHGSGAVTDSDGAAYVPFLRARGYAVLRYDKRGVGRSSGVYRGVSALNSDAQIGELAGDMAAALDRLATMPEIDGARLGPMGTSQAGWVMAAALERSARVRFVIAVSGSVVPVGVNIRYENLRSEPIDTAYAELAAYSGPRGYDPEPTLRGSRVPTLWLLGEADRLVPTRNCRAALEEWRLAGSATESVVYPASGHGLPGVDYWTDVDDFLHRHAR